MLFQLKGFHTEYECVCTHVSACVHVFNRTRDYTEHCCRQGGRKEEEEEEEEEEESRVAAGSVASLITKQTTTGSLPYRINAYVFL